MIALAACLNAVIIMMILIVILGTALVLGLWRMRRKAAQTEARQRA
jgi:FtsZ-interacting cell division protein ZipA